MAASVDMAPVTSAACAARWARKRPASASGGRRLRTVDEGEALLGGQDDRRQAGLAKGLRTGETLASEEGLCFAHHDGRHVASGARSPEAPTEPFSGITGMTPFSSIPSIRRTSSKRTPDAPRPSETSFRAMIRRTMLSAKRRADAAAMRQDQVALKRRYVRAVDLDRGKFSEAGIDAVDGRVASCDLRDAGSCLGDAGVEGCIEPRRRAGPVDRFQILQRDGAGVKSDGQRSILSPLKTCA